MRTDISSNERREDLEGTEKQFSRRALFGLAAMAPLAIGAAAASARAGNLQATPCFDPNALPASQKGMRRSLNFKVVSPDPAKMCGGCAFYFQPSGNCGKCQLLTGGPVAANSVCDSWAKKP